jgi:iron complex transport system substrate-binding protein
MRIVSLLASATEIICELGAGDWLVGRSHECDNPPRVRSLPACTSPAFDIHMSSRDIDAEVRRRLRAREPLYYVNSQSIAALKPDLIIAQAHCEVCAVTPGDVERAGCATFGSQILALQAGSLEGIFADIATIAEALGQQEQGRALIARLKNRLAEIENSLVHERQPSLVMLEWTAPVFPMSNWGPELVTFARGNMLLGKPNVHSRAIEWSDVRAADPEFLIVAPCGFNLQRTLKELPVLQSYPGWRDLRAVRENKVFLADGNLYFNRSGITVVNTAEIIADILHGTSFFTSPDGAAYWQSLPATAQPSIK